MKAFLRTLLLFVLILFLFSFIAGKKISDDPRVEWIKKNAVDIKSVDPSDTNFSDLEHLKKYINDSIKIVMLGEQSHGDGTTFLMKTRMIKFLHKEMGFDMIAFESNMFYCDEAWEDIKKSGDAYGKISKAVFDIWTSSAEVQPLICYIDEQSKTSNSLVMTGFDNQFYDVTQDPKLYKIFGNFLTTLRDNNIINISESELDELIKFFPNQSKDGYYAYKNKFEEISEKILKERYNSLAEKLFPGKASYYFQLFESFSEHLKFFYLLKDNKYSGMDSNSSRRDIQMGKNLVWLQKNNPGKRIIVWAATFHEARNLHNLNTDIVEPEAYKKVTTMGDIVDREIGNKVYTIGFTAYDGMAGRIRNTPQAINKAREGTLEYLMNEAGFINAFVDFSSADKNFPLRQKISAKFLGYMEMEGDWTKTMDGFVYTKEMKPSTLKQYWQY